MPQPLSTNLDDPQAIPYFLWSEPMTVAELHHRLSSASEAERLRLLALVLREARDTDVWRFVTPQRVAEQLDALAPRLGRRRPFWVYLIGEWRRMGLL